MFHFPLLLESHNDKRHGVDWGLETMSRIALLIQYIRNTPTHGWEFSLSSHKKTGTLDMGFYAQTWQPATSYAFYHIFNLIQNKKFPEIKVLLLWRSGRRPRWSFYHTPPRSTGHPSLRCAVGTTEGNFGPRQKTGANAPALTTNTNTYHYLLVPVLGFIHTCSSAMFIIGKSDLLSE